MSKHVLRVLGLSLMAALGLMAVAASGAQAANLTPAEWKHGKILILGKVLHASVTGKSEEPPGKLLVPALGIEITCASFDVNSGLVNFTAEEGHGEATVLFLGCKVFPIEKVLPFNLTSSEPLPCLPLDSMNGEDGSIHAKALVLVVLHENDAKTEKKTYLIFEDPNLVPPISRIVISPGTGCPIPLKPEVKGQVPFLIETGDLQNGPAVLEPLIKADGHALPPLFGAKLLYGTNEAFIDGSAKLKLTGAHLGCTWGFI